VGWYHKLCPSLPAVRKLTDAKKRSIAARWKDFSDIEVFKTVFQNTQSSDHHSGRNGAWTGCNFDWLMGPKNFEKMLERNQATGPKTSATMSGEEIVQTWGGSVTDNQKYLNQVHPSEQKATV